MFIAETPFGDVNEIVTSFRRSDDRLLPAGNRVSNGVLYLYDVHPDDAGEYACIGTNRNTGSILYTIYATVQIVG